MTATLFNNANVVWGLCIPQQQQQQKRRLFIGGFSFFIFISATTIIIILINKSGVYAEIRRSIENRSR
jgi:hypothetical protein